MTAPGLPLQIVEPPHPATQELERLMRDCSIDRVRRSGPGGQHRNKVETGVVLIHTPTGVRVEATELRSQAENLQQAQKRLRLALAVQVRTDTSEEYQPSALWRSRCQGEKIVCSESHADFPALLAEALDLLARYGFDLKAAAETLGCTSSQLLKFVHKEPTAAVLFNAHRQSRGLKPLK